MLYWLLYEKLFPFFHPLPHLSLSHVSDSLRFADSAPHLPLHRSLTSSRKLREFQIGQYIREEGPKSHQKKSGTPTMGGLLIVVAIVLPTLLWADPANPFVWITVLSTLAFGAIGFADDYIKVIMKRNLGLTARAKLFWQTVVAVGVASALAILTQFRMFSTELTVPFLKSWHPNLIWHWPATIPFLGFLAFVPFVAFVVFFLLGSSNAVNLTDGLDGLAIGCTIIAAGAFAVLTYVTSSIVYADYLEIQRMPMVAELTVFCGSMVGASIGFLWYNAHPAEIFMGDVGSLALGGAIGTVAVVIRQELLLPFVGGVFIIEALSVILQVGSYKFRNKKRIFKMAPLHHHFEQLGWSESKVIVRFWILALIFALLALTTLKLR